MWPRAEGAGRRFQPCRNACDCNGHSERCHFDPAAYLARGVSGVCKGCAHHTEGAHCERCRPLFYWDHLRAASHPRACLPCECDPDGTVSGGLCVSHSDPASGTVAGQCLCKENVQGAKCDQCKANHYGLSVSDPQGCQRDSSGLGHQSGLDAGGWGLISRNCSPCDCETGGASANTCSPNDGQCECCPHIVGRSCTEPAPGYFFPPLNFYLCEAGEATPLQGLAPLILATVLPTCDVYFQQEGNYFRIDKGNIVLEKDQRQSIPADEQNEVPRVHIVFREPVPGKPVSWTGSGFAKVLPGAGLRFAVDNIPFPTDFTVSVRYETQSAADWAVRVVVTPPGGSCSCAHKTPWPKPLTFALPAGARVALLPTPVCLEPGMRYSIDVYFSQSLEGKFHTHSHILVDSLGLIPQSGSLEASCSQQAMAEDQLSSCVEAAAEVGPRALPAACDRLVASISAKLHDGALGQATEPLR